MSLSTGRILHRKQWEKLSINKKIIDRVEKLANKENQGYISSNFKYKWRGMNNDDYEETPINIDEDNSRNEEGDETSVKSISEFMT